MLKAYKSDRNLFVDVCYNTAAQTMPIKTKKKVCAPIIFDSCNPLNETEIVLDTTLTFSVFQNSFYKAISTPLDSSSEV